ncbi:response regulator [Aliikangiella marina]|uniref:Response regulator n=1 Tax=Aliikangiella marina TaxID=1712262 RepID=A0A545T2K1_9GAMM|nr:response regulator [Aliikangiella marina]TQV71436.1 response regulator [Aliikangiella marina]
MDSKVYQLPMSTEFRKVLVIDDEPLVRQSIAVYLEDSGYDIIEAQDGQQGVELFKSNLPDVVLCDLRMPGMDGLEVLKTMTEIAADTPVIMVSGAGQINDVVEALRLGALDYIVKPVTDMAVLENAVANALRRHELEEQNRSYRKELETANAELERNLELLQEDQEAGRRAQIQLLPEPQAFINGYRFQHVIVPSLNLSGDFIDYFQISDRFTGFYIADVSGHGAAAAFVTMTLKSLINQPLRDFRSGKNEAIIDPATFITELNQELINANLGKHITLFYGVIDNDLSTLDYCVAGQYPAPIMVNNGRVELLTDGGFPVGLFEWASFENRQVSLAKDFKLLMVSDGWLEVKSADSHLEGEAYLYDYVMSHGIDVENLMYPVKKYPEDTLPDDVTVFYIKKE